MALKPPWFATYAAALREGCTQTEARRRAGVNAREVAAACEGNRELERELDAAREGGQQKRKGGTNGDRGGEWRIRHGNVQAGDGVGAHGDSSPASLAQAAERPQGHTRPTRSARGSEVAQGWQEAAALSAARETEERPAEPKLTPKRGPATREDGEVDVRATLQAFRDEAAALHGPGLFGLMLLQEARLASAGFHPISPWWLLTVEGFLASLKRWMLILAGRGAGKSTMLTRLAVVLALFSPRRIPPGQTWIWPFVSVRPGDAKKRLQEIQAILLHAYHYELKIVSPESTPTLALEDAAGQSIAFVSFASTLGNVSGPNSIGATVDEEEKLERNPAEVVGSLAQTFRARPGIRGIRCSSVFKVDGTLVRAIERGDSITNYIARIGERDLPAVLEGLEAVAQWEAGRGDQRAAERIRAYAATVTAESFGVPTWLGNQVTGAPEEEPAVYDAWTPAQAAVATRVEVEAADERILDGLTRADYWLRENASVPPGGGASLSDEDFEIVGEARRYAEETPEERWYG